MKNDYESGLDDNLRGAVNRHTTMKRDHIYKKLKIVAIVQNKSIELLLAEIVKEYLKENYERLTQL